MRLGKTIGHQLGRGGRLVMLIAGLAAGLMSVSNVAAGMSGPWLWPKRVDGVFVGDAVAYLGVALGTSAAAVEYRYSISRNRVGRRIVRDFHPSPVLWYRFMEEGRHQIVLTARDRVTGELASVTRTITVRPRTTASEAVVAATEHPLVALYSIAPCASKSKAVRVRFAAASSDDPQYTQWKPCDEESVTFLVAGMRAETTYHLQHQFAGSGGGEPVETQIFKTGQANVMLPPLRVDVGPGPLTAAEGVLLHSMILNSGAQAPLQGWSYPFATDLEGRLIWYYPPEFFAATRGGFLTRPVAGGTFLLIPNDLANGVTDQFVREVDFTGATVGETTGERINEQLQAMGLPPQLTLHHEAVRLPNGHTLVIAAIEEIFDDIQGQDSVHLLGDMVIDLDENWQVAWAWRSFDHLDLERPPVLGETTRGIVDGTPPIYLSPRAVDWTHMNTITYSGHDGNLLLSSRNQSMVYKIDYRDGNGSGRVLWRLGAGGDYSLKSNGKPDPWFSHQHQIMQYGQDELVVLDNGNVRCDGFVVGCASRGQVYKIDEERLEAELALSVDLGEYAMAFGSAQRLENGNYHFLLGVLVPEEVAARSLEVTPSGTVVHNLHSLGLMYRSFRGSSLYDGL